MNITDFNDLTLAVNRVRNLAVVIMRTQRDRDPSMLLSK